LEHLSILKANKSGTLCLAGMTIGTVLVMKLVELDTSSQGFNYYCYYPHKKKESKRG